MYRPTYEVEGFELVTEIADHPVLLVYVKGTDTIVYNQYLLQYVSRHINTEGIEPEDLEFRGFPAKYYSNIGNQTLMWYDENYLFTVSSTLDKEIVFKIAESVEKVKTDVIP